MVRHTLAAATCASTDAHLGGSKPSTPISPWSVGGGDGGSDLIEDGWVVADTRVPPTPTRTALPSVADDATESLPD
jgi:hypothetical protein